MVGKEKVELSKEHQEQRMNDIHKQQNDYYNILHKRAFEKGLNDYYNELLKKELSAETDEVIDYLSFGAFAKSEKSEGELWDDLLKDATYAWSMRDLSNDTKCEQAQNAKTEYDGKSTPSYYIGKYKQITAADVVADFELSYNCGNSVVYCLRAGKKEGNAYIQDLKKAVHHLNMEIEQHERK